VSRPAFSPVSPKSGEEGEGQFRLGQRVLHTRFGEGVVLGLEGYGAHARVQVNFSGAGSKWLVIAYANLHPA
jgi:DNA helicase-2/ATP-dependent DNA helicase PcrA